MSDSVSMFQLLWSLLPIAKLLVAELPPEVVDDAPLGADPQLADGGQSTAQWPTLVEPTRRIAPARAVSGSGTSFP